MNILEMRELLNQGKTIYDLPLRVTYYARVSTDFKEQETSLVNQNYYYKELIKNTPAWTYHVDSNKMMFEFPRKKYNRNAEPVRVKVTDVNLCIAI